MSTVSEMGGGPVKVPDERVGFRQPLLRPSVGTRPKCSQTPVINSGPGKLHWTDLIPFQECENTYM